MTARRRRTVRRTVIVPLWSAAVHVIVGETMLHAARAARRWWPGVEIDGAEESIGYTQALPDDAGVLVLVPASVSPGTLAHECAHAAMFILARAQVRVSTDDDESLAYTLGHLVDEVAPWLERARASLGA